MGRSPKDKRVVVEKDTEGEIWRGAGSPNYEMDDRCVPCQAMQAILLAAM